MAASLAGNLKDLDAYLLTRSYISKHAPSQDDCEAFAVVGATAVDKALVNVYRWQKHMLEFSDSERKQWPAGAGVEAAAASSPAKAAAASPEKAAPKKVEAAKEEEEEDDDDDLFGDDDDEEAHEAMLAAKAKLAKKKDDADKPKARSMIVLDVKPFDEDTDMEALAIEIKKLTHPGIQNWGEQHKLVDVAYGIKKLVISAIVFDDLCGVDEMSDMIMADYEDKVQSIDVAAMSKV